MLIIKLFCTVLAVVAAFALLLIFATIPRAGVRIKGKDGALDIWLRYGLFKLHIYPLPAFIKKPKPKKATKHDEKKPAKFDFTGLDSGDVLYFILEILDELRNALRLEKIHVDVMLATGDAARTGILLGQIAALTGMIIPFLEQNFNIRDYHIYVDGDFEGNTTHWEAELLLSVQPIRMLWALIKRWRTLKKFYTSIQITEAKQNE